MKANGWHQLSVFGVTLDAPKSGPQHFMPLFTTREAAVEWEGGSDEYVREVTTQP